MFLHPLRHRFEAANQAGIPDAAGRAEKANVEQTKKIVPFVTCEIAFCQNVCELMFGVDVSNLNFRIKIILSNNQSKATLWVLDTCLIVGLPTFDYHFDYRLIVLKDIQHSTGTRILCIGRNVTNVCWNDVGVHDWDGVMHV